jgi:mannose-6-phosphate isomerase-like protein (cupin superfamily)
MNERAVLNPVTGERILRLPSDPRVLRLEHQVPPEMVPPPVHLHRHSDEVFEVLEGQAKMLVAGRERMMGAGESFRVEAGTPHTWWNGGDGLLRMGSEYRPAGHMQSFFETFGGLAAEGACDCQGQPAFLQIAASAEYWDTFLAKAPLAVQRTLFAILRPVAHARGYRAEYPRFEGTLGLPVSP